MTIIEIIRSNKLLIMILFVRLESFKLLMSFAVLKVDYPISVFSCG